MSQRNQKIKLKKRSRQSARIHRGFAMPVGPGSENSLVSFRDFADLKAKYFRFTGRIQRRPFICYLASYVLPVLGQDTAAMAAQSIMAVSYLGLFTVKGTSGDNAYGSERAR